MSFREVLQRSNTSGDQKMHLVKRTSRDVLEQAESLPFWSQDYTQLDKGSFTGEVSSVTGINVQVFRESMNRAVDQLASAPKDTYVIGLPTIIEGDATWGGEIVQEDSLISLDKNAELLFRTAHFSEITAAVISAKRLEDYAEEVEGVDLRTVMNNVNPVEIIPASIANQLLKSLNDGAHYLSKNHKNPNVHHIWRHYEDNLLSTCLMALLQANDCNTKHYDQRIHRYIVNRVRDLTLTNEDKSLTIGEICLHLNVSRRTLNHAFIRVLGITPVEYMRYVRLHRIRAELQSSFSQNTTIADIAAKWGFWHMSLFARYYRELFGECPSETLERTRLEQQ